MKKYSTISLLLVFLFALAFTSAFKNNSYADTNQNGDYKIKTSEAFPDENLQIAVSLFDFDSDGYLDKEERDSCTYLKCTNVKSFIGIQELRSLETVDLNVDDSNLIIINDFYSHSYRLFDFVNEIWRAKESTYEYVSGYPSNQINLNISAEVPDTSIFISNSDIIRHLGIDGSANLLSVTDCFYLNGLSIYAPSMKDLSIIGCPDLDYLDAYYTSLDYLDLTNYRCGENHYRYLEPGYSELNYPDVYHTYENNYDLQYYLSYYLSLNPHSSQGVFDLVYHDLIGYKEKQVDITVNPSTNVVVYPVTLSLPVFPNNSGTISVEELVGPYSYTENHELTDNYFTSAGTQLKLSAESNEGYRFKYWICDNEILSTYESIEFKATKDRSIVAVFESDNDDRISIDQYNFPDANFRTAISTLDHNNDKFIDESEYLIANYLNCSHKNIQSLKGIELLPLITDLHCNDNSISELDLSHNTSLVNLDCSNNPIQELNIDNNKMLTIIQANNINDKEITIRNLPRLQGAVCYKNDLDKLHIYNCMDFGYEMYDCCSRELFIVGSVSLTHIYPRGNVSGICVISGSPYLENVELDNWDKIYVLGELASLDRVIIDNEIPTYVNLHGCANWEWSAVCEANEINSYVYNMNWIGDIIGYYYDDPVKTFIDPININVISNVDNADSITGTFITERGGITYLQALDIPGYNFEKWVINNYEVYNHEVYDRFVVDTTAYAYYSVDPDQLLINEYIFPDDNFLDYVKGFDTDNSGSINKNELSSITSINCSDKSISSLQGIEYFTHLRTLDCSNNNLASINLSGLTELSTINCSNNNLTNINLSGLTKLKTLDCSSNKLTSIDISGNLSLTKFNCSNNEIDELSVVDNSNMVSAGLGKKTTTDGITTYKNSIYSMTVDSTTTVWYDPVNVKVSSDNIEFGTTSMSVIVNSNEEIVLNAYPNENYYFVSWKENGSIISSEESFKLIPGTDRNIIATFHIDDVAINSTNFPSTTLLNRVKGCDTNNDNYLDVFEATMIEELHLTDANSLTGLNYLKNLKKLVLDCNYWYNIIDFSELKYVQELEVNYSYNYSSNNFKINGDVLRKVKINGEFNLVDLSNADKLEEVKFCGTAEKIDLSSTTNLKILDAKNALATEVVLDNCNSLEELSCPLGMNGCLDFSNTPSIRRVDCNDTLIQSINLQGCNNLIELSCENVPITKLDLSSCVLLETLNINNTNIGTIVFSNKDTLKHLYGKEICISKLDLSGYSKLETIDLEDSKISELNLSGCQLIQVLDCESMGLTSLNLTYCYGLTDLKCNDNQLANLDISTCGSLKYIDCSDNNIGSLNLSCQNTLEVLLCANNDLGAINLNNCVLLRELICNGNNIVELSYPDSPYLIYASDKWNYNSNQNCYIYQSDTFNGENITIKLAFDTKTTVIQTNGNVLPITNQIFPDNDFCEYIRNMFDIDRNGYLNNEELENITEINTCDGRVIHDCSGIEHFYNLEKLTLSIFVKKIDFSHLENLKHLSIECNMASIDLSHNTALEYLDCHFIGLKSLDLTNNIQLKYLDCSQNKLSELSLINNTELEYIHCGNNNLSTLQVSHLSHLKTLYCGTNKLSSLNLSNLSGLMYLYCEKNQLESIILPTNSALETLDCSYNSFQKLNLSDLLDLKVLLCNNINYLAELMLPSGERLEEVTCNNCALTSLNLEGQSKLQHVNCSTNSISQINLNGCNKLKSLDCSNNRVNLLRISSSEDLEKLYCANNQLTQIDISGNKYLLIAYSDGDILSDRTIMNFSWRRNPNSVYTYILKYDEGVKIVSEKGSPTSVPTDIPDSTPTATPSPTKSATPTPTSMPTATPSPTRSATPTPTSMPTTTPVPTINDKSPTPKTSVTPTVVPTEMANANPSATPTEKTATTITPTEGAEITPTATPTPTPVSAEPKVEIESFINRIYIYVLERDPDKDGSAYWTDELYSFSRTGSEVAQGFIFSPEFINRNTSDREFIYILYKTFFGREPDDAGMNYWLDQLSSKTMDRATVANGFIYSQEWADTCAEYGIRSGGDTKPKISIGPTELTYAFVERMYTTAMKREYDEEGRNYWASELANFNITGEAVGASFFLSEEMNSYKLSDQEYINRLYQTFMDRKADTEGLNYWLGYLKEGHTREEVVYGFTRSPEFTEKCITARILPY